MDQKTGVRERSGRFLTPRRRADIFLIFTETTIAGLWRIELDRHRDQRGFFARTFCASEFEGHGLLSAFEQSSLSHNDRAGTIRGMHVQHPPHDETKLVRCVRGSVFDVAIDLRPGSPTRGRWHAEVLSAENGVAFYIPGGLAHGFQTLEEGTDVLYQITPAFRPGFGDGVRWNDPAFGIDWPMAAVNLSERDASYPDWRM